MFNSPWPYDHLQMMKIIGIIFVFYLSTPVEETKRVKFFSTSSLLTALICSLTMSPRLGLEQAEKQAIKIRESRRGKGIAIENLRIDFFIYPSLILMRLLNFTR